MLQDMIHDDTSFHNTAKEPFKQLSILNLRPAMTIDRLQDENKGFTERKFKDQFRISISFSLVYLTMNFENTELLIKQVNSKFV